jgi:1-acyl-sn-glycerol-3-phosphate acyltransferase
MPADLAPSLAVADLSPRLLGVVRAVALELHPKQVQAASVTLDSSLDRDLAFDSLGRLELFARLEKEFDVTLAENLFAAAETPRDLLRLVLAAAGAERGAVTAVDTAGVAPAETAGLPVKAETLVEVLDWHAGAHPERPHIRLYDDMGDGEVITFRDLADGATRVAAGLQRVDLRSGEAVLIMLPTGREYFLTFFGILLAGGIPVPIYPPGRPSQIEEHLRRHATIAQNCRAALMVTSAEAAPFARLMRGLVDSLRAVTTVDDLIAGAGRFAAPKIAGSDIAFLQYTSGSTGNPKGVVLTHHNLLANVRAMGQAFQVTPADVLVSWLPLYHDMGLIGAWLGTLYHAVPLVIMSPLAFLARPQRWLRAIHRFRGTISTAPNFAYELCARRIEDKDVAGLDLSSWRIAANGAEPISPDTLERFAARFAPYGFRRASLLPVYGLAECSVGLAFTPVGSGPAIDRIERDPFMDSGKALPTAEADARALRFVVCGVPLPGHQIRVVDDAERELPDRRQGRIEFRGPSATSGYFRNPEATRALIRGDWLDSGDLGYMAEGRLVVTGRLKDMIIRAGRNIYPAELEAAIGEIPGILKGNVAVFASRDPTSETERLVVMAECRKRDPATLEDLRRRVNERAVDLVGMPADDVALVPPGVVPKTSSGKIRRAASRALYEKGALGEERRAVWLQLARVALAGVWPWARRWLRGLGAVLYAGYCYVALAAIATPTWITVALLPREPWRWAVVRLALRALSGAVAVPVVVQGRDHLPREGEPCILVANHASYVDGPVLILALGRSFRFVAKIELLQNVVPRVFLSRIGTEFVERLERERSMTDAQKLKDKTRAGDAFLFFPEGTFTRVSGLLPFHMGAFVAAAEAGVPVVPIAIRGTRSILRDGSGLPRRGAVAVVIGAPLDPKAYGAPADPWAAAIRLREAARAHILRYCGEPDLEHERSPVQAARAGERA